MDSDISSDKMVHLALINNNSRSIDYETNIKRVTSMKNKNMIVANAKKEIKNYDKKLNKYSGSPNMQRNNLRTLDSISKLQGAQLRSNQSYDFGSSSI